MHRLTDNRVIDEHDKQLSEDLLSCSGDFTEQDIDEITRSVWIEEEPLEALSEA